jgi:serine kinase of HPr protein (carbohydrate metabolism regulator)
VVAHVGGSSALVDDLFRTAVMPLALQVSGYEVLHASAVRTPGGVAAFCGMSGTGKSTVAYGLSRRGYPLWADDAVVFSAADDRATRCFRIPFALHLREASREYFAAPATETAGVDSRREASELTAIVVLERVAAPTPSVEPVSIAAAMRALLPHAYRFTLTDPARARRTVQSYLDVAARVPVFSARYTPGFVQLPALLDAIEHAVMNNRQGM